MAQKQKDKNKTNLDLGNNSSKNFPRMTIPEVDENTPGIQKYVDYLEKLIFESLNISHNLRYYIPKDIPMELLPQVIKELENTGIEQKIEEYVNKGKIENAERYYERLRDVYYVANMFKKTVMYDIISGDYVRIDLADHLPPKDLLDLEQILSKRAEKYEKNKRYKLVTNIYHALSSIYVDDNPEKSGKYLSKLVYVCILSHDHHLLDETLGNDYFESIKRYIFIDEKKIEEKIRKIKQNMGKESY